MSLPFTVFNFAVVFTNDEGHVICEGAFSEVDGLEMSMKVKTIREGGNNNQPIHLMGPGSYGQLTLKRGMSNDYGLWNWFDQAVSSGFEGHRLDGQIFLGSSDRSRNDAIFNLTSCVPTKLKAPGFNAKEGGIAIEEMRIVYERLQIENPNPAA